MPYAESLEELIRLGEHNAKPIDSSKTSQEETEDGARRSLGASIYYNQKDLKVLLQDLRQAKEKQKQKEKKSLFAQDYYSRIDLVIKKKDKSKDIRKGSLIEEAINAKYSRFADVVTTNDYHNSRDSDNKTYKEFVAYHSALKEHRKAQAKLDKAQDKLDRAQAKIDMIRKKNSRS